MTRIAVVEDDESIQKLITYALTANGYEARGFSDGQSFLDDAEKFEPALVLLDVMMPGIDGIQVLRCLRRSAKFAEIPVMMLTAKSAEADKVSTLDLGADDYMTKPFGVMEMLSRVKALLRRALADIRDGDILMAHLGIWSRRDPFAPMLDPLIAGLKARGLCFATLPAAGRGSL